MNTRRCHVPSLVIAATALIVPSGRAVAGNSTHAGYGCGAVWQRNPHALVDPSPNRFFITFEAGPVAVVGTGFYAGLPATNIAIRCYVVLGTNSPTGAPAVVDVRSKPATGVAYLSPTVESFTTQYDGQYVGICQIITWTDPDGTSRNLTPTTCSSAPDNSASTQIYYPRDIDE